MQAIVGRQFIRHGPKMLLPLKRNVHATPIGKLASMKRKNQELKHL